MGFRTGYSASLWISGHCQNFPFVFLTWQIFWGSGNWTCFSDAQRLESVQLSGDQRFFHQRDPYQRLPRKISETSFRWRQILISILAIVTSVHTVSRLHHVLLQYLINHLIISKKCIRLFSVFFCKKNIEDNWSSRISRHIFLKARKMWYFRIAQAARDCVSVRVSVCVCARVSVLSKWSCVWCFCVL